MCVVANLLLAHAFGLPSLQMDDLCSVSCFMIDIISAEYDRHFFPQRMIDIILLFQQNMIDIISTEYDRHQYDIIDIISAEYDRHLNSRV